MKHVQAIAEITIASLCAAVICFSLIPPLAPQQTLIGQDDAGQTTEFVLPIDDARVVAIAKQWEAYNHVQPSSEFAMASWTRDLASHYATDTTKDSMVAAWQESSQAADRLVSETRQAMYRDREPAPAIQLGDIRSGMMPPNAIWFALMCGMLVGCVFWKWNSSCPIQRAGKLFVYGPATDDSSTEITPLDSEPNWFRVTQPISVQVRRSTLAVLIACMVFCIAN